MFMLFSSFLIVVLFQNLIVRLKCSFALYSCIDIGFEMYCCTHVCVKYKRIFFQSERDILKKKKIFFFFFFSFLSSFF